MRISPGKIESGSSRRQKIRTHVGHATWFAWSFSSWAYTGYSAIYEAHYAVFTLLTTGDLTDDRRHHHDYLASQQPGPGRRDL